MDHFIAVSKSWATDKHNEPSHRLADVIDVERTPPVHVLLLARYVLRDQIEWSPRTNNAVGLTSNESDSSSGLAIVLASASGVATPGLPGPGPGHQHDSNMLANSLPFIKASITEYVYRLSAVHNDYSIIVHKGINLISMHACGSVAALVPIKMRMCDDLEETPIRSADSISVYEARYKWSSVK